MPVLVYVPELDRRRRLARRLEPLSAAVLLASPDPARAAAAYTNAGCVAAIVATLDGAGRPTTPLVRLLHERWPGLPVLLAIEAQPGAASLIALVEGIRAGASAVVPDPPPAEMLRAVLARHVVAIGVPQGLRDVLSAVPVPARAIVECCLADPAHATGVADVARHLGVHRRTLVNWCRVAGVPAPELLIARCRIVVAAYVLSRTAYSVERVAVSLGFDSGDALRSTARRCGLRIRDLRDPAGYGTILGRLTDALRGSAGRGEEEQ